VSVLGSHLNAGSAQPLCCRSEAVHANQATAETCNRGDRSWLLENNLNMVSRVSQRP